MAKKLGRWQRVMVDCVREHGGSIACMSDAYITPRGQVRAPWRHYGAGQLGTGYPNIAYMHRVFYRLVTLGILQGSSAGLTLDEELLAAEYA